jgi:hypothetical protein
MIGLKTDESKASNYHPSPAVEAFTLEVKSDYSAGHNILTRGWNELNDASVIEDMNRGRRMFNAFVDESFEDPNDAWKWRGTRSKARNKGIAMHANLTAGYMLPTYQAQNEDDEVDRGMSDFMTDLVEWMAQDENSDYMQNFLSLVFAMESDPVVYLGAEYQKVMQDIKIKEEDGKMTKKEILDEVLSGFKAPIYTADQVLISNAFERNIQKHRFNIKRKWIEYQEAHAKYSKHENWDHVIPGHSVTYSEDDGLFYEVKDPDHEGLVEEVTYSNRRADTEVCFLGGIYMGDGDVDKNPIKHRDNFGAPRYNVQQFGFYPIGSHFFFYKSMMNAMRWDNALYDASTEIIANRAILDAEAPMAVAGLGSGNKISGDIIFPNAVVSLESPDAKPFPLLPPSQLGNIITSLNLTEESMEEGSISETASGQLPAASQKAHTVALAAANSKKIIGGVAKGLAASIARYGLLLSDIAINNFSIPMIDDITGENTKLKYRKFVLNNKEVEGKRMSKQLYFDEGLIGAEMTPDEEKTANLDMYKKSKDMGMAIYAANPEIFAKRKYLSRADYREVFAQNDETMQAILTNLYAQLNADPMIEREALLRELMYSYFKSKGDKFIAKMPMQGMQGLPAAMGGQQNGFGAQVQQKAMAPALGAAGLTG